MIGPNNVAVPTHFFKVIVGETENRDLELEAFVLPNEAIPDSTPLVSFQVFYFIFSVAQRMAKRPGVNFINVLRTNFSY